MPGTFSPPPRVSYPDMHHGTCVTHVQWCMSGSLTSGFIWKSVAAKTFPVFQRMHNPKFSISGKRPKKCAGDMRHTKWLYVYGHVCANTFLDLDNDLFTINTTRYISMACNKEYFMVCGERIAQRFIELQINETVNTINRHSYNISST